MKNDSFSIVFVEKRDNSNPYVRAGALLEKGREKLDDKAIKDLALKIYRNEVFTSMQVHEGHMELLSMIFMPLMLVEDEHYLYLRKENISHVYAYTKDCMPRMINGYPQFHTCYFLTDEEADKVIQKHSEIVSVMEGL